MEHMENIIIAIPENKVATSTTDTNGNISITFKDKVVKDWAWYVREYKSKICDFPYPITSNMADAEIKRNSPDNWRPEFKFGLLKFIADDLNEINDVCKIWSICYDPQSNSLLTFRTGFSRRFVDMLFTEYASKKACKIIPVDFIKSFLP